MITRKRREKRSCKQQAQLSFYRNIETRQTKLSTSKYTKLTIKKGDRTDHKQYKKTKESLSCTAKLVHKVTWQLQDKYNHRSIWRYRCVKCKGHPIEIPWLQLKTFNINYILILEYTNTITFIKSDFPQNKKNKQNNNSKVLQLKEASKLWASTMCLYKRHYMYSYILVFTQQFQRLKNHN